MKTSEIVQAWARIIRQIAAIASGERRDQVRHEPRLIVKGVTYHQLKIEKSAQGWPCEVYLDI